MTDLSQLVFMYFFFNDTATTDIYTLSLHDALPISYYVRFTVAPDDEERLYFVSVRFSMSRDGGQTLTRNPFSAGGDNHDRSEEHTSELQSRSELVCRLLLEKKNPRATPPQRPHLPP